MCVLQSIIAQSAIADPAKSGETGPDLASFVNRGFEIAVLGLVGLCILVWRIRVARRKARKPEYGWSVDYRPDLLILDHKGGFAGPSAEPLNIVAVRKLRHIFTAWRVIAAFACILVILYGCATGAYTYYGVRCLEQGRIKIATSNYYGAEMDFRKALKVDPTNNTVRILLADSIMRQNRPDQAVTELLIAVHVDHPDPRALTMLGDCLQYMHRLEDAEEEYRLAIKLAPNVADPYFKLSNCLEKLNRVEDCVKELRIVVKLDPKNVRAHASLGRYLLSLGFTDEGLGHLERAVGLAPDDVNGLHNLASVYVTLGRFADAADLFRAALAVDPDNAKDYFNLGFVLRQMHDTKGAVDAYNIYVAMSTHRYTPANIVLTRDAREALRIMGASSAGKRGGNVPTKVQLPQMVGVKQAMDQLKELEPSN